MMEIVIKISDEIYKFAQNTSFVENESSLFKQTNADRQKTLFLFDLLDAIKSGTPLPKYLSEIKDEIEALEEGITSYHNDRPWIFKDEVLQIIDKHIERS